ncbi:MAG: S8 family serine peptidase [Emcibacter sp.]|nr:S8 family serine peptidase [Emcibacter sp.]
MTKYFVKSCWINFFLVMMSCLWLASCGGTSSGGGGTPVITPPPSPINYNTVEYRNNYGLDQIHAIVAYDKGATGAGITVAVIDSGIDSTNLQIKANIHPDSTNIVTGQKADLQDVDGHGTGVSGVIAAVRNPSDQSNVNSHGVAFDAKILAINTADIDSCSSVDGCVFSDYDIAAALDYARVRGVKIVNISLGGDGFNLPVLVDAYKRAVDAGMIIVLAAGNRDDTDTDLTIAQPENSASVAWQSWANGQIIVAGAVDSAATIADFSHRAGDVAKDVFLVAGGQEILSLGIDENGNQAYYLYNGTSFSAPHIAGAAALLMDAFPNLTGKQVVDLLYSTATDLGVVGADIIYGRGLVNLEEAFKPQGVASIAVKTAVGGTVLVDIKTSVLLSGGAFGSFAFFSAELGNSMMLDGYNRSFRVDLGQNIFRQDNGVSLQSLLESNRGHRMSSLQFDQSTALKFMWQEDWRFQEVEDHYFSHQNISRNRNHALRMRLDLSLSPNREVTISEGLSLNEIMGNYNQEEFLTIGREDFSALMGRQNNQNMIFGQKLGSDMKLDLVFGHGRQEWQHYNLSADSYVVMAKLDKALTASINFGLDVGLMNERGSVLGSLSSGAISLGEGAMTKFSNLRFDVDIAPNVNLFSKISYGVTSVKNADLSLVGKIGDLASSSFLIGMMGNSLFQQGDQLSLAVSQPLRVVSGYADISYASHRNYQTDSLSFITNQISLAPNGREIDVELAYRLADFFGARMDINILHQINPSHNRENGDNSAILFRLGSKF